MRGSEHLVECLIKMSLYEKRIKNYGELRPVCFIYHFNLYIFSQLNSLYSFPIKKIKNPLSMIRGLLYFVLSAFAPAALFSLLLIPPASS